MRQNRPPMSQPSPPTSSVRQLLGLAGWLAVAFAAAAIGGIASADAGTFYASLTRPAWAPPGWLFAPVWTTLYFLMGVSAWLVWRGRGFAGARAGLTLFIGQLAFNALWSWLFFVWRQGALAFAEVLLLWCLIAATILAFWRISALAAVLLLPYLAWVTFASALTFAVWRLNPGLLG
jgi:translocator protein